MAVTTSKRAGNQVWAVAALLFGRLAVVTDRYAAATMNTPRTRLSPGRPWVNNPAPALYATQAPTTGHAGQPAGAPRPPGESGSSGTPTTTPMPGVEVNELNSDTVFDRLFGPLTPAGGPGHNRR